MKNYLKKLTIFILVITIVFGNNMLVLAKETNLQDVEMVKEYIRQNYKGTEYSEEELYDAAIKGMTELLDQYSTFYNIKETTQVNSVLKNEFVGIGISFTEEEGKMIIKAVFDGGAAKEAGVKVNDVITKVDGESIKGLDMNEVADKMLGKEGTNISVTFIRGENELIFNMQRRLVINPTVKEINLDEYSATLNDKKDEVKAIKIESFSSNTDIEFSKYVDKAKTLGAKYLIIDLRDNGGGYVNIVANMANKVMKKGTIITMIDKYGNKEKYESTLEEPPFKIITIVNENSASASEIFASVAKDSKAGVVIGENTFGKGVAQSLFDVDENKLFRLTTFEFFSRNGDKINGVGVEPDIIVDNPEYLELDERVMSGDRGEEVEKVEQILKYLGYFDEVVDYVYDYNTSLAVADFQESVGLYPYGVCDFSTQRELNLKLNQKLRENDEQLDAAISWIINDK